MKSILTRYLKNTVELDLAERMVLVGGPRQAGKTTFALTFLSKATERHPAYLNWDNIAKRPSLLKGRLPANQKCIVLDDIHKFARWRNRVKGFYDTNKSSVCFLITGSARLDYYSKGGDSLQGRYPRFQDGTSLFAGYGQTRSGFCCSRRGETAFCS